MSLTTGDSRVGFWGFFRQLNSFESRLFTATLSITLFDAVTTLAFYLSGKGFEMNPILRRLLMINPFLAYPFFILIVLPMLFLQSHKIVQLGVALLLITTHTMASLNNLGILFFNNPFIVNYFLLTGRSVAVLNYLPFLIGLLYISLYTSHLNIRRRAPFLECIRSGLPSYLLYLAFYILISLLPLVWIPLIR